MQFNVGYICVNSKKNRKDKSKNVIETWKTTWSFAFSDRFECNFFSERSKNFVIKNIIPSTNSQESLRNFAKCRVFFLVVMQILLLCFLNFEPLMIKSSTENNYEIYFLDLNSNFAIKKKSSATELTMQKNCARSNFQVFDWHVNVFFCVAFQNIKKLTIINSKVQNTWTKQKLIWIWSIRLKKFFLIFTQKRFSPVFWLVIWTNQVNIFKTVNFNSSPFFWISFRFEYSWKMNVILEKK